MNSQGDIMQYGNTRGDPKYRIELATFLTRQYGSYPVDKYVQYRIISIT